MSENIEIKKEPNTDIKYVCNICLNTALCTERRNTKIENEKNSKLDNSNMYSMDLSEKNDNLRKEEIDKKIKSRIVRSEKVKDKFGEQSRTERYNERENKKNENGTYWCGEAYDKRRQRVLNNYNNVSKLNTTAPSFQSSKGKKDYYDKCVKNVESTINKQEYIEKDPETLQKLKNQYNEELTKQIEDKKNMQNKAYYAKLEREKNEAEIIEKRYQKQREENKLRRIKRNNEFNTQNQALISARINREKEDKVWEEKYMATVSAKAKRELDEIKKNEDNLKLSERTKMSKGLDAQLLEKEKIANEQRLNDIKLSNLNSLGIGKRKKNTANCECCHKTFEKYVMTPESNYKNIIETQKKRNFKK